MVRLWSTRTRTPRRQWLARPRRLDLGRDRTRRSHCGGGDEVETLVVLDGRDGSVRGATSLGLSDTVIESLVFLDNQRILGGDETGEAQVWPVTTGLRRRSLERPAFPLQPHARAWSADWMDLCRDRTNHRNRHRNGPRASTPRPACLRPADFASVPPTEGPMAVDDSGDRAAFLHAWIAFGARPLTQSSSSRPGPHRATWLLPRRAADVQPGRQLATRRGCRHARRLQSGTASTGGQPYCPPNLAPSPVRPATRALPSIPEAAAWPGPTGHASCAGTYATVARARWSTALTQHGAGPLHYGRGRCSW